MSLVIVVGLGDCALVASDGLYRSYAPDPTPILSATLVLADPAQERVRIISWVNEDGFIPCEPDFRHCLFVLGHGPAIEPIKARVTAALNSGEWPPPVHEVVADAIRFASSQWDGINDRIFAHWVSLT